MKPIVLVKGNDDKVNITIDEFKKYIDDAYEAGREDGRNERSWHPWISTTPYYASSTDTITISGCNVSGNTSDKTGSWSSNIKL